MNTNNCCETPWVRELSNAADDYGIDSCEKNWARFRLVLLEGIYRNEALPLEGEEEGSYCTVEDEDGKWLLSCTDPTDDSPGCHGESLTGCMTTVTRDKLAGLLIESANAEIKVPAHDLIIMMEALYGGCDAAEGDDGPTNIPDGENEPWNTKNEPESEETNGPAGKKFDTDLEELDDNEAILSDFLVRRPLSEEHFETVHDALSNSLQPGGGKILIRFANYYGDDGMQAVLVFPGERRFHVSVFYSMDDFGWSHPLVLGDDIGLNMGCDLIRRICCSDKESDKLRELSHFRDETYRFYDKD